MLFCMISFSQQTAILDNSFGNNGKIITDFGNYDDQALRIAIQPDGKVIVVGKSYNGINFDFALVRYNSDGIIDSTFGTNGKVLTDFGKNETPIFIKIQTDGKFIVVGNAVANNNEDFVFSRYNHDGSLDTTFGNLGKVIIDFAGDNDYITAINMTHDNEIIIGGLVKNYYLCGSPSGSNIIAKYDTSGSLDSTFGYNGIICNNITESYMLLVQQNEKIVLLFNKDYGYPNNYDFALAQYNSDGSLDTTFGISGIANTDFGGTNDQIGIGVLTNNKILIAGTSGNNLALARYNSNGDIDTTFNNNGFTIFNFELHPSYLFVQDNEKIIVASNNKIARINSDCTIDTSFGDNGILTYNFANCFTEYEYALEQSLIFQTNEKFIVAGYVDSNTFASNYQDFAVVRFINSMTFIEDIDIDEMNIIIYPNPNNGNFFISLDNDDITSIEIINIMGNVIYNKYWDKKQTVPAYIAIDISNSPKGIYLIRLSYNDKTISKKIIYQ